MAIEKVKEYFRKYGMEDRVQEFDVSSATVESRREAALPVWDALLFEHGAARHEIAHKARHISHRLASSTRSDGLQTPPAIRKRRR